MRLDQILMFASERLNEWRRMHDLLCRATFEKAFNQVQEQNNEQALEELQKLLYLGHVDGLRTWMQRHWRKQVTEYSIKELRVVASSYNITHYYRLTKQELLHEVTKVMEGPTFCKKCHMRHDNDKPCEGVNNGQEADSDKSCRQIGGDGEFSS